MSLSSNAHTDFKFSQLYMFCIHTLMFMICQSKIDYLKMLDLMRKSDLELAKFWRSLLASEVLAIHD